MSGNSNTCDSAHNTCHSAHSYEWCQSETRVIAITCGRQGTVRSSLRTSPQFRRLQKKNPTKELVVLMDGRPIASHAPCTMIQPGERVIVKFVKSFKQPLAELSAHSSEQLVMFNVVRKGGRNITKIIGNTALKSYAEFTVYAFQGEKVKHALKRDGRFHTAVFDKTCALSDKRTNVITEMSSLVNDLNGKTFQIILLNRDTPLDSQSSSLEDCYITNDSQLTDLDENNSALTLPGNEIPGSRQLCSYLNALMREFFQNTFKDQNKSVALPDMYNLFREEYGRSQGYCEAKTLMALTERCKSVCQVRINDSPVGSGFLLFNTFVITCAHVIKDVFNKNTRHLSGTVTVHFSFISLEQTDPGHRVQEVVAFEHGTDVSGHMRDWTLLSLCSDQGLPSSLLTHTGLLPQSGRIWLIGHPYGGVKQFESTLIIPVDNRPQVVETHFNENLSGLPDPDTSAVRELHKENPPVIRFLADAENYFYNVAINAINSRDVMYETCFYFGSSGCPVFDNSCNIIAMHSGGFTYKDPSGKFHSIIEYGHSVSDVLENLIVELVRTERLDVLKSYLLCPYKHHDVIKNNVKKLVSRNYTAFEKAAGCFDEQDHILGAFFRFVCEVESPEPMALGDSGIFV